MLLIICCFFQSLFAHPEKATVMEDTSFHDRIKPRIVRLVHTIEQAYQQCDDMIGESVTQQEHALQTADLALKKNPENKQLIAAALLHDLGRTIDPHSGNCVRDSYYFIKPIWGDGVAQPIHNLIKAKRFLTAVDADYEQRLSPASRERLEKQGGPFAQNSTEYITFKKDRYFEESIALRMLDDRAKDTACSTRDFTDYHELLVDLAYAHIRATYTDSEVNEAIMLIRDLNEQLKCRL